MKYEEETSARALYDEFSQQFAVLDSEIGISIQGQGVHWSCTVIRAKRACAIACFQGSEYHISFRYEDQMVAMGRTSLKEEIIAAASDWMRGVSVQELYERFVFVDKHERALLAIEREVTQCCPELKQYASVIEDYLGSEFNELWFSTKDRSCHIYFYGENEFPDALFYWDDCQLFQVQTGQFRQLAFVLKGWLHEYAMPSALESEFPWIEVGKLARYYEEGRGVEGEFVVSWDKIEEFYQRQHYSFVPEVLDFIAQIRQRGFDTSLRAGQSLWMLIVSRSRRHGLQSNQSRISFDFHNNGMEIESEIDEEVQKVSYPKIEYTTEIDRMLKHLEAKDID